MQLPAPPLLLLLLLWRSLHCASESTITHATNVSKRQLQYGDSYAAPGYQLNALRDNPEANAFMHSSRLLYDPGYNAQHSHEVGSDLTSRSANSADAGMGNSPNAPQQFQQSSQEARKFDNMANGVMGLQYVAPQTFSHIYFPHVYSPSSQLGPGRTAPHVFPGDTSATMAARNNGQSYSTSSTYFVPTSVLYHPNVGPQQQHIQPPRQVQQQQQQQHQQLQQQHSQAYSPLPPPLLPPPPPPPQPAQFPQYAPQHPPPFPPPPSQPSNPQPQQQQQQSPEQQQSTSQQTVYQRHSQQPPSAQAVLPPPLPPLPRLPHLPHGPPPPPLNFQAPFRASQFLGYMPDEARGGMPHMRGGGADERAPLYTEAYPMMGPAPPLQQQLGKPIYERMRENFMNDAAQQNYQAATTQHARYGRYIYMAPRNVYALFKAA